MPPNDSGSDVIKYPDVLYSIGIRSITGSGSMLMRFLMNSNVEKKIVLITAERAIETPIPEIVGQQTLQTSFCGCIDLPE